MPDRDVKTIRDLISVCEDYCETTGPQIMTFWGLRCASRGGEKVHILRRRD